MQEPGHIGMVVRIVGRHATPEFDWDVELLGKPVRGYAAGTGTVGVFRFAAVYDWNLSPLEESARSCRADELAIAHAA
jgi:hypothetical protein